MNRERGRIIIGETCIDATVETGFLCGVGSIAAEARGMVERKIRSDPFFGITYSPYAASGDDEELIVRMCDASVAAGVGPMAAVAGAVASYVLDSLIGMGCGYAVINNGGDIALMVPDGAVVGVFSGTDLTDVCMVLPPSNHIWGICSSSGRIGHSVSLGNSDIATVVSRDPVLSDACATRFANSIVDGSDSGRACEDICSIDGVEGALAICDGTVAVCGDVPEMIRQSGR